MILATPASTASVSTICGTRSGRGTRRTGGDLYELPKILGHSNIKMTERYAKLGKAHIASTGGTARAMWKLMQREAGRKTETGS
jgi:hypothetical protein